MEAETVKRRKALVLFSGGLDSRIAVKNLQEQDNLDVECVFLKLPFGGGCCGDIPCIINFCQTQGVKLHIVDVTSGPLFDEYLGLVKDPKYGRGTGINPCKDCKIFMLQQGKRIADEIGADIIVTGEVVGQRPMSQVPKALTLTEEKAGLTGRLLRPLSAKLLPPTEYETSGMVDREKMLSITGRQRKIQIALAEKYKIKYPSAGGGCLLCEKSCATKMSDNFLNQDVITPIEVKLINVGRHFRAKGKIIIGRNSGENDLLVAYQPEMNFQIYVPKDIPGPTVIYSDARDEDLAKEIVAAYSKGGDKASVEKWFINF
ncbi:MAG: tRNA-specific 2-thiouridylase [Patescibacteria group bacterium]|jgi:tRNA-specific 2-thiouridylase